MVSGGLSPHLEIYSKSLGIYPGKSSQESIPGTSKSKPHNALRDTTALIAQFVTQLLGTFLFGAVALNP